MNTEFLQRDSDHHASFGGPIDQAKVSLRIFSDDLEPDEISCILNCEPTYKSKKGEIIVGPVTGNQRIAPIGMWSLESAEDESVDLEEQILTLLSRMSGDLNVWKALTQKYKVDLFCGLFLDEVNRSFWLTPEVLKAITERNLKIGFDIYAP
jgi:hypothetical protein